MWKYRVWSLDASPSRKILLSKKKKITLQRETHNFVSEGGKNRKNSESSFVPSAQGASKLKYQWLLLRSFSGSLSRLLCACTQLLHVNGNPTKMERGYLANDKSGHVTLICYVFFTGLKVSEILILMNRKKRSGASASAPPPRRRRRTTGL